MQIYLSDLSLRETMRTQRLSVLDLPGLARDNGFSGIELSDRLFGARADGELRSLAARCREAACGLILDINCDLTYSNESAWRQEIEHVQGMMDAAHQHGARIVRVCLGGQSVSIQSLLTRWSKFGRGEAPASAPRLPAKLTRTLFLNRTTQDVAQFLRRKLPARLAGRRKKITRAAAALRQILPHAKRLGVKLAVENHWGITARPENILRILEEINSSHLGTCPDFGNFPGNVDPYKGLRMLAPYAFHAHAKSLRFGSDGEEKNIDYGRCLRILCESGYDGALAVEYVGAGKELEGCSRTRALIMKHWGG